MRLTRPAVGKTNCVIEAPNFGAFSLMIETVGYGMSIAFDEAMTRNNRVYYPFVRTSGSWYIEAVFTEVARRNQFHGWLLRYIVKASDQYAQPMLPLTVTVAKANFVKTGYFTSNLLFGDRVRQGVYRSIVQFASASDPELAFKSKTVYRPPTDDKAALHFYPSGPQNQSLPPPQVEWTGANKSPFDDPNMPGSSGMGVPKRDPFIGPTLDEVYGG